ncbi:MAG: DUF3052 family protein [Planctomycetes bacterium]|nr:DUF3052 family protein [Planctomycetota bacterium]
MAGYSGSTLPTKLGIKDGDSVLLCSEPRGLSAALGDMPSVKFPPRKGSGSYDVILYFTRERAALERELAGLRKQMGPACGLWICWPKKASKVVTDMNEEAVREIALPTGLVDNKVCAIDSTWSGLRLVIRKELRE